MDNDIEDLVKRAKKKRNHEAKNQLVKLYYKEIFAYIFKQIRDEHLTLDLTQEVFIKTLKAIHNYDPKKASFRTFLYRIAHNHMVNYLNSKLYKTRAIEDEYKADIIEYDDDIEENILINEQSEVIKALILKLSNEQQEVIRLRFYAELTLKEISEIQNVSESTVKSRLYQSLSKLKSLVIKEGYYEQ